MDRAHSVTSTRYNQHVAGQKRNTVNFASLQMLFLMCVYILTYEAGVDIESDTDQPSLNLLVCLFALWLITKPLCVFTYYDDLILTY